MQFGIFLLVETTELDCISFRICERKLWQPPVFELVVTDVPPDICIYMDSGPVVDKKIKDTTKVSFAFWWRQQDSNL